MTLTVTSDDLELYLGIQTGTIDTERAELIIRLSMNLCASVVSPLPDTADAVVLRVAARQFANPEGVTAETVGSYTVQRQPGLFLSRSDKADLRRLAGGTGAFSIETLPPGVNAVQLVTVTATGGTFTLALTGQSTTALAFNASSAQVLAALTALPLIGAGNISVTGEGPYTITFINGLGHSPIPTMTADTSLLTGGTAAVATTTRGVFRPGEGLAPWDRDLSQRRR